MAFNAYLKVVADRGPLKGFTGEDEKCADGSSVKEMSRVQSLNHSIRIQTNPQSGETQGTSDHSRLMVTIELDRSVAELYKAMSENARMTEVKVYLFRSGAGPRASGKTNELFHNWFTITLTGSYIAGIDLRKAFTMEGVNVPDLLDISFSYYKINWEDHDDKKQAEYAWNAKTGGK